MASSWTVCVIFISAFFSAGGVPLKEDPLVAKVKQIVANVNSYLEEKKQDEIQLPGFRNFTADDTVFTNLKLTNYSTMELVGGPFVQQNQSISAFNVTLRLTTFNYQVDFDKSEFEQKGHITITLEDNYYLIEGFVEISEDKSCHANLTTIDFHPHGLINVDVQPDSVPRKEEIVQEIYSFISPSLIFWYLEALKIIKSAPSFDEDISNIICHVLVS